MSKLRLTHESVISYDRDLPQVAGRLPWEAPRSYLVKDDGAPTGWREERSGRRPSRLLLVPRIRGAVDAWRAAGYPGASEVTRRLFAYWFEEDHDVPGFDAPFRYYFCQREAIETLAWLVEAAGQRDARALIRLLFDRNARTIAFQTTMDGRRQLRRYVAEIEKESVQDLPPENLRRYAFKLATGAGKTWVMAMAVVWSHFHRLRAPDSGLSANFLIVAPNVIVYQRLEKDFADNRIFLQLPLIPPEWRGSFKQRVILRGDAAEPGPSGNLLLTNVQQLYESRGREWRPANPAEALLGKKPAQDLAASAGRSVLERVKALPDLVVMNDEAHHVHDEDLAWSRSLLSVHDALPDGIGAWLDFSATPKDRNGMFFPWTVCDYPLAQAVEDRIVKAPIIVTNTDDAGQPVQDPGGVTRDNAAEKYGYWLQAAVRRWREHRATYRRLGVSPVLFIMVEKNVYADALGAHLTTAGFKESEVLVIHTDTAGEVRTGDLEKARQAARDIDDRGSRIKAIVSVMMLREGWDVRNVTVVLGLRPFTAKAEILPEQVIGRGLRLMTQVSPDRTQTLEVLGTRNLLNVLREQLEAEGVGVTAAAAGPPPPVTIEPVRERLAYDIAIPITKPSLTRATGKLGELDVRSLSPIYDSGDLAEPVRIRLRLEFAPTETEVHQDELEPAARPAQELLAGVTGEVGRRTGLTNRFAELYPLVRRYVSARCFGRPVDVDDAAIRAHLTGLELREAIAAYLAAEIGALTVERRPLAFDRAGFRLSATRPFSWRRDLPPPEADKTVFNYVATYNAFERSFAEFLDRAADVLRFAALGTTEQGASGTAFRVDYLKATGAIGFYYPDWVAVQQTDDGEVNWIIETKGRVWEDTGRKDDAMQEWRRRVRDAAGMVWRYLRVNQTEFRTLPPDSSTLRALIAHVLGGALPEPPARP